MFNNFKLESPRKRYRAKLRVTIIILAGIAAFFLSMLMQQEKYELSMIPLFVLIVLSISEFVVADILTDNLYPIETEKLLERLRAKMARCENDINLMLGRAIEKIPNKIDANISATFHLSINIFSSAFVNRTETALVQIVNYSGNSSGKRWRITPSTKGIIGRCMRTKEMETAFFNDDHDYDIRMIKEFGFTQDEIINMSKEARSFLAFPVEHKDFFIGVLYFFSNNQETFKTFQDLDFLEDTSEKISYYLDASDII